MISLRTLLLASAAVIGSTFALPAAVAQTSPSEKPAAAESGSDVVVITGSQVDLNQAYAGGQVAQGGRVGIFGALDIITIIVLGSGLYLWLARRRTTGGEA